MVTRVPMCRERKAQLTRENLIAGHGRDPTFLCGHGSTHSEGRVSGEERGQDAGFTSHGRYDGHGWSAPGGDGHSPQVDTAENVQISSLALLKMLKHGRNTPARR